MPTLAEAFIAKPTEAQGYLAAAEGMLAGALPLAKVEPQPVFAITLLCGHATEAALKAVLAHHGKTAAELSKAPYGHNLVALWNEARAMDGFFQSPPQWIEQLNSIYSKPFALRYPLRFHAMLFPNQVELLRGAESLIGCARSLAS